MKFKSSQRPLKCSLARQRLSPHFNHGALKLRRTLDLPLLDLQAQIARNLCKPVITHFESWLHSWNGLRLAYFAVCAIVHSQSHLHFRNPLGSILLHYSVTPLLWRLSNSGERSSRGEQCVHGCWWDDTYVQY